MNASTAAALGVEHLSDDDLVAELHASVVAGRENDARMLLYLIEVEARGIYLARACSSMYDYCQRELGMSGGQAHRRIAAARLAKDHPFVLPLVARGMTHLSTLAQIRTFVNDDNVHSLVADTAGKNRDEVDWYLAERFNLRKSGKRSRGVIAVDDELDGLIKRAFELECHAVPDGDRQKLAKRAFRALIADAEKRARAKTERPRPAPPRPTKRISRASTRAMFSKHGEQCCYVDPTNGERCQSRVFIQRNHIRMRAHGGGNEAENLNAMCGPHNRYLAALALGRSRIERAIRLRQQRQPPSDDVDPATE